MSPRPGLHTHACCRGVPTGRNDSARRRLRAAALPAFRYLRGLGGWAALLLDLRRDSCVPAWAMRDARWSRVRVLRRRGLQPHPRPLSSGPDLLIRSGRDGLPAGWNNTDRGRLLAKRLPTGRDVRGARAPRAPLLERLRRSAPLRCRDLFTAQRLSLRPLPLSWTRSLNRARSSDPTPTKSPQ